MATQDLLQIIRYVVSRTALAWFLIWSLVSNNFRAGEVIHEYTCSINEPSSLKLCSVFPMSFIYTCITNTHIVHCTSLSKKNVEWWHLKFHKRHSLSDLNQISTQSAAPFFFHPLWLHRDSPHSAGVWWWRPGQWRQWKGVRQLVITENPEIKSARLCGRWLVGETEAFHSFIFAPPATKLSLSSNQPFKFPTQTNGRSHNSDTKQSKRSPLNLKRAATVMTTWHNVVNETFHHHSEQSRVWYVY